MARLLAFSRCMRSHGVANFPDPTSSGVFPKSEIRQLGVSLSQLRSAQTACAYLLPPKSTPTLTAQQEQDYLHAAACMRAHGITNFPDPAFHGGHVNLTIPSSIDTRSPQFAQAAQACQKLIPPGLPYSGSRGPHG